MTLTNVVFLRSGSVPSGANPLTVTFTSSDGKTALSGDYDVDYTQLIRPVSVTTTSGTDTWTVYIGGTAAANKVEVSGPTGNADLVADLVAAITGYSASVSTDALGNPVVVLSQTSGDSFSISGVTHLRRDAGDVNLASLGDEWAGGDTITAGDIISVDGTGRALLALGTGTLAGDAPDITDDVTGAEVSFSGIDWLIVDTASIVDMDPHYFDMEYALNGDYVPGEAWELTVDGQTFEFIVPSAGALESEDRALVTIAEALVALINGAGIRPDGALPGGGNAGSGRAPLVAEIASLTGTVELGGTLTTGETWNIDLDESFNQPGNNARAASVTIGGTYNSVVVDTFAKLAAELARQLSGNGYAATAVETSPGNWNVEIARIDGVIFAVTTSIGRSTPEVAATGAMTSRQLVPVIRVHDAGNDFPFSFDLSRGGTITGVFDIDYAVDTQTVDFIRRYFGFGIYIYDPLIVTTTTRLELFKGNATGGELELLAYSYGGNSWIDDGLAASVPDVGSDSGNDPFIRYNFAGDDPALGAGYYYARVSSVITYEYLGQTYTFTVPYVAPGTSYELNVSLPRHDTNEDQLALIGKTLTIVEGEGAGLSGRILDYDAESSTYTVETSGVVWSINNTSRYDISHFMSDFSDPGYDPRTDYFEVVLTAAPVDPDDDGAGTDQVYVTVTPLPTRTYNSADAFKADNNFGENEEVQLRLATSSALLSLLDDAGNVAAGSNGISFATDITVRLQLIDSASLQLVSRDITIVDGTTHSAALEAIALDINTNLTNYLASVTSDGRIRIDVKPAGAGGTVDRFYLVPCP